MILSKKGFSLLEVMISLLIFSFISIFIVQNVQNAVRARKNFKPKMEKSFRLRTVFLLVRKDINQAFHFRDFYITKYNEALRDFRKKYDKRIKKGDIQFALKPKIVKQETYFKGSSKEFSMTSFNSLIYFSENTSYSVHVKYSLKNCENKKGKTSQCLVRKEWILGEEEPSQGVYEHVLIRGIQSLEFFYLSQGSDKKTPEWSSLLDERHFPAAVEILFETEQKEKFRWVISLHFVNNKEGES